MSEAMSSVEIEDVLSSIRRLVSEDLRPGTRPAEAKKPVEAKKPDDKLLLTPAFRVVPALVAVEPAEPSPRPVQIPRLHLGVEKSFATLERAVEDQDAEWESEVGDPAPLVVAMDWSEVARTPVQAAKPVYAPPVFATEPQPTPSWAQEDAEMSVELEEVLDHPIDEPDSIWADQAEAEVLAELRAEEVDGFPPDAESVTFDEEVLRNLVRDMIREELQGDLGERITRNVRKLVRAEIARALATQDLDQA
jgi:hypothetical protein